jgi:hypothetical protein
MLVCSGCKTEFKVVAVNPFELVLAPGVEEGWARAEARRACAPGNRGDALK